jgi:hypothetical protein
MSGPHLRPTLDRREAVSFGAAVAGANVGPISGIRRTSFGTDDGASAPHSRSRTSGQRSPPPATTHDQRRREESQPRAMPPRANSSPHRDGGLSTPKPDRMWCSA